MKEMSVFEIENFKFLEYKTDKVGIYFSTAMENLNFNKNTQSGLENLKNLKKWFGVQKVGYLNQTHSDSVIIYDNIEHDGDALITNEKGVAIGIFTADCVPILIYDKSKLVIAAVHSGWKGTLKCIVSKTIDRIINEYNSDTKDLEIYIGPHNMMCCYEVSEELIEVFKSNDIYKDANINNGRNLSLNQCIIKQLKDKHIEDNQIHLLNMCTYCSEEYTFHSYRRDKEDSGRIFSFIFIK